MKFLIRAVFFGLVPLILLIAAFGNSGKVAPPAPPKAVMTGEVFGPEIPYQILWSGERCLDLLARPPGLDLHADVMTRVNCGMAQAQREQTTVLRGTGR